MMGWLSVQVVDSNNLNPLSALVVVELQTQIIAKKLTGNDGIANFMLEADTYLISVTPSNSTAPKSKTVELKGNYTKVVFLFE
jgi:hypothetical protein